MKRCSMYVLPVIVGLLISSCGVTTRMVNIETLTPAKYPVAYADKTVAIFNALHIDGDQYGPPYVYASDSLRTGLVAQGVKEGLEASGFFNDYDIPVYNLDLFCNDSCPDLYSNTYLYSLSEQAQAALLIIVDSVDITVDQTVEHHFNSDYGEYYRGVTAVPYKVQFRFYDAEAQHSLPVFRLNDTLSWDAVAWNADEALGDLPEKAVMDTLAPAELGRLFAETTLPEWMPERRFYFTLFGEQWRQAEAAAGKQDWKQAVHFWNEIVRQNTGKNAAYAAFNIALGSEIMGEYDLALEWLQMADQFYSLPETEGYRQRLQKRLAEKNSVEQQLE